MLRHFVRAALHGLRRQSILPTFTKLPRKSSLLWNELVVVGRTKDRDLLADKKLIKIRRVMANRLQTMAEAVSEEKPVEPLREPSIDDETFPTDSRETEYLNTLLSRYKEVESILLKLPARAQARWVARPEDAARTNS
jgi:hypothetical protein